MKPSGTDRKQLTNYLVYDTSPTYSPDGTKIAFGEREGGVSKIYTMNAHDGSDQRNLSGSTDGEQPAYSPSGTKIAFVGQGEDIWVMNTTDGSARQNLTNTPPVNGFEVRERSRLLAGRYQDSPLQGDLPSA
jgi:TolB protein